MVMDFPYGVEKVGLMHFLKKRGVGRILLAYQAMVEHSHDCM